MIEDQKPEDNRDPDPSEIEIDEANDKMGGPTTGSLDAGLSSSLQPGGTMPGGGPGTGVGSLGTGGGQTAGQPTGNAKKPQPE
jgi:hypothetical protein